MLWYPFLLKRGLKRVSVWTDRWKKKKKDIRFRSHLPSDMKINSGDEGSRAVLQEYWWGGTQSGHLVSRRGGYVFSCCLGRSWKELASGAFCKMFHGLARSREQASPMTLHIPLGWEWRTGQRQLYHTTRLSQQYLSHGIPYPIHVFAVGGTNL